MASVQKTVERIFAQLDAREWLMAAICRFAVGTMFMLSGYSKLGNLDYFVDKFAELGIPAPALQAPFVAGLEFFGGLLLMIGLASRPFAALLGSTMVVAMATDRIPYEMKLAEEAGRSWGLADFLYLQEWLLLLLCAWIVFRGGGKLSADAMLARG